jgi:hypothetical protein
MGKEKEKKEPDLTVQALKIKEEALEIKEETLDLQSNLNKYLTKKDKITLHKMQVLARIMSTSVGPLIGNVENPKPVFTQDDLIDHKAKMKELIKQL